MLELVCCLFFFIREKSRILDWVSGCWRGGGAISLNQLDLNNFKPSKPYLPCNTIGFHFQTKKF